MGIISRLFSRNKNNHTEALEDLPVETVTSQRSVDTEHPAFFLPDESLLIPPFNLTNYLDLYLTDALSKALIDSDTNLVVSPLQCTSENDELCEFIDGFHRRIDIDNVTWQLVRDANLYGFGLAEIVGNGSTLLNSSMILGLKRLDPRFVMIQKDRRGHYRFFRQRPGLLQNAYFGTSFQQRMSFPLSYDTPLDPQSIVFVQNWSPLTSYGHSMLQSLKSRLQERNKLIDAAVLAARNHSNPVLHLHYKIDPELPHDLSDVNKVKKSMRAQVALIDKGESRWLISSGRGEFISSTIGHSSLPDITNLLDRLTQEIIVAAGHSPSSLGFTSGATRGVNTFEASSRQTINTISTKQRNLVTQLQNKLYRILPLIESDCPDGEIIVKMQEPTSESMKERLEAQSIQINNSILAGKAGLLSGNKAARELGYESLEDEDKWDAITTPTLDRVNTNDPNKNQAIRSAIDSTTKGNNPNGT
ncbi:phage portal protein [Candidatus Parcubacteria bacterium]|nr:MAG: phage portal protein [Candidatus Parcubacteria bacterium]